MIGAWIPAATRAAFAYDHGVLARASDIAGAALRTDLDYKFAMGSPSSRNGSSIRIAGFALVVAVLSLLMQWVPADAAMIPTPVGNAADADAVGDAERQPGSDRVIMVPAPPGDWLALVDRVGQLESRRQAWSRATDTGSNQAAPTRMLARQPNGEMVEQMRALGVRVANFE